jgi:thiaminase
MALHIDYCASFGLSKQEMEGTPETIGKPVVLPRFFINSIDMLTSVFIACTAYSRYILDIGQSEDWLALQMALAPCLIGYGAIAKRLYTGETTLRDGNTYWKWIENYVADDYTKAVQIGSGKSGYENQVGHLTDSCHVIALLEDHMQHVSPSRMEELIKIFVRATELEIRFWDMGLGGKAV